MSSLLFLIVSCNVVFLILHVGATFQIVIVEKEKAGSSLTLPSPTMLITMVYKNRRSGFISETFS
jgi:hypothetical protein